VRGVEGEVVVGVGVVRLAGFRDGDQGLACERAAEEFG
jgi:hypothetical protein